MHLLSQLRHRTNGAQHMLPSPFRSGRRRRRMIAKRWVPIAFAAGIGVAVAYFFDPDRGRGRRAKARDRSLAIVRRGGTRVGRVGRFTGAHAYGFGQKVRHLRSSYTPVNDAALTDKVKTELFRKHPEFKHISINTTDGIVWLRGEVQLSEDIERLAKAAQRIQGVREVENLLHLVNTPSPNTPR